MRESQEESIVKEVLSEGACVVSYRQFVKLLRHWLKGKSQIIRPKLWKRDSSVSKCTADFILAQNCML